MNSENQPQETVDMHWLISWAEHYGKADQKIPASFMQQVAAALRTQQPTSTQPVNQQGAYELRCKDRRGQWSPWVPLGGGLHHTDVEIRITPQADSQPAPMVGTIAHVGTGKTTLAGAITSALRAARAPADSPQARRCVMRVLTIIGGLFLLCVFAGALITGVSCHFYFGTDQGALEWHRKNATDNEAARKQGTAAP